MKLTKVFWAMLVIASVFFAGCKSKDADIKADVEKALRADNTIVDPSVEVNKGVVTISGQCKDEECRATCEATVKAVKGVKSVINNCTVPAPAPVPESVNTMLNETSKQQVRDGLKDIPGVNLVFTADKAVISGQVTAANRKKIMQILASAKVLSDVTNLKDKK